MFMKSFLLRLTKLNKFVSGLTQNAAHHETDPLQPRNSFGNVTHI